MSFRRFYDLPVYRVSSERFYADRAAHVDRVLYPSTGRQAEFFRSMEESDPDSAAAWRSTIQNSYGPCWEFNEIVGYIRLHFLGTQVRGEYYGSPKKRIVRSRSKTFVYKAWKLAPELEIDPPYETPQVLSAIREYIAACRKQLPRRHIDSDVFEAIAPHVDWASLLQDCNA